MTKFKYRGSLEKWIFQNAAEVIDCVEGCLLDNYLVKAKNGFAMILETYANSNSSINTIIFERGNGAKIIDMWDKFRSENE